MSSYKPLYPSTKGKKGQVSPVTRTTAGKDVYCYTPGGEGGGLLCLFGSKPESDRKAEDLFRGTLYRFTGTIDEIRERIKKATVGNFLYLKRR